jgi:hypothetical protein
MTRYLLDTNAVGDFVNHRYGVPARVQDARARGAIIVTCEPVVVISIPPRLLAVRSQKVGPAGGQVPGDVLHDDGDGIRIRIESGVQIVVRHLLDGSIRQTLVGLESVDGSCHEFGGDVHSVSLFTPGIPGPAGSRVVVYPRRYFAARSGREGNRHNASSRPAKMHGLWLGTDSVNLVTSTLFNTWNLESTREIPHGPAD